LVYWKKIEVPKAQGGKGLKNIFMFSKDLTIKNIWQLLQGEGLLAQVIRDL